MARTALAPIWPGRAGSSIKHPARRRLCACWRCPRRHQGGACGAAGPALAPGSALGGPPGARRATRRDAQIKDCSPRSRSRGTPPAVLVTRPESGRARLTPSRRPPPATRPAWLLPGSDNSLRKHSYECVKAVNANDGHATITRPISVGLATPMLAARFAILPATSSAHGNSPPFPPDRESASNVVDAATIIPSTDKGVVTAEGTATAPDPSLCTPALLGRDALPVKISELSPMMADRLPASMSWPIVPPASS